MLRAGKGGGNQSKGEQRSNPYPRTSLEPRHPEKYCPPQGRASPPSILQGRSPTDLPKGGFLLFSSFVHVSLLAIVHRKESLVWFDTSGFYYTLNVGLSRTPLSHPAVLCCGAPAALGLLHMLPQIIDGVGVGVGHS